MTLSADVPAAVADLGQLAQESDRFGLIWSGGSDDLNVNVLLFARGDGVSDHVNAEVDVLIVCLLGEGEVSIDGFSQQLAAGHTIVVAKGATRSTLSKSPRFAYLTCHRRRGGLQPAVNRSGSPVR